MGRKTDPSAQFLNFPKERYDEKDLRDLASHLRVDKETAQKIEALPDDEKVDWPVTAGQAKKLCRVYDALLNAVWTIETQVKKNRWFMIQKAKEKKAARMSGSGQ